MNLLLPPLSIALLLGATKAQATSADQFEPWQTIGYTSAGPQDFSAVLSMAIPTHPAVLGYSFTAQAATAAPGTPLGFALTNGITATVLR